MSLSENQAPKGQIAFSLFSPDELHFFGTSDDCHVG
jgi:hypothetical protein